MEMPQPAKRPSRGKLIASSFVVGIGGATAAGKTSLARALAERFRGIGVSLVDQDSYYLDHSHLDERQRQSLNFDEPFAYDHNSILCHLEKLLLGEAVQKPCYNFRNHSRTSGFQLVQPAPLIILEGLYALWDSRISILMNLRVYVDAEQDLRFIRRLRRDVAERGRSMESTITRYLTTVRPMHRMHIEPTKRNADLVIDTSESFARPLAELVRAVSEHFALDKSLGDSGADDGENGGYGVNGPWQRSAQPQRAPKCEG